MNYEQLIKELRTLCEDNIVWHPGKTTVTVLVDGEYVPITGIRVQDGDDVLDDGHLYLVALQANPLGG